MELAISEDRPALQFGSLLAVPARRELLVDGRAVEVGGRAFEILLLLIAAQGAPVTKNDIAQALWPGAVAEENTIEVHVSALRKALREHGDMIRTVWGRGYRLVEKDVAPSRAAPALQSNLPTPATELIGREDVVTEIAALLTAHRIVTLTGIGGIGKTRLALEVARRQLTHFADGAWLAEFAALSDPNLVPDTVAAALGLELSGGGTREQRLARAVGSRHLLLLLDNCEHVVDAVTRLAEAMLHGAPRLRILVTSREPLRSDGECVFRVPPLDVPDVAGTERADEDELLRHGAVRLFVARWRAAEGAPTPAPRGMAQVATLCRQLDGIPLAIELAAARAAVLGVGSVVARLGDRFRLLTGGHRTALPRHQTLRATLDWSHDLLAETERVLLRRLAVFAGGFTLEAAIAVGSSEGDAALAPIEVVDGLSSLVAKSLVTVEVDGRLTSHRMLETTRAYAREKLDESGERDRIARLHAEHLHDVFGSGGPEARMRPDPVWLAAHDCWTDNLRAALDWAFSAGGDARLGVSLMIRSLPLWVQWNLLAECGVRTGQALATIPAPNEPPELRMQLWTALGAALTYTRGPVAETGTAWEQALDLAERAGDVGHQLQALRGLWIFRLGRGSCYEGLRLAERFAKLADQTGDPGDRMVALRMIGVSQHYLGQLSEARRHIEEILDAPPALVVGSHAARVLLDQPITAQALHARTLWLQGHPDAARRAGDAVVAAAERIENALPLCHALAQAMCPIALFSGDVDAAELAVARLLDHAQRHGLAGWVARGQCFQAIVTVRRGDAARGAAALRAGLGSLDRSGLGMHVVAFLGALAEALDRDGKTVEAIPVIDEALARSERDGERWCLAELLRIRGLLFARRNDVQAAAALFREAIATAERQGAMSWVLRAAIELARLPGHHDEAAARQTLAQVYARFQEGFATADLVAAKALLGDEP